MKYRAPLGIDFWAYQTRPADLHTAFSTAGDMQGIVTRECFYTDADVVGEAVLAPNTPALIAFRLFPDPRRNPVFLMIVFLKDDLEIYE